MSILIADSGATKTEWYLYSEDKPRLIKTEGLNPYYHTSKSISEVIRDHLLPELKRDAIKQIYFYGAGCDSEAKNQQVKGALQKQFPTAEFHIYHDLLAAARACFLDKPGIACILGTGSNSCLYDGNKIVEHIPSLAFILGDEGSAAYFGKQLINRYFRFEVPEDLKKELEKSHNMSLEYITREVYDGTQKSRFVASYGSFLGEHAEHPFIQKILREGFENFITRIVMNYSDAADYEVRFIGSVAHAYQDLIREILREHGLTPGPFIQKPMQRLVEFHTQKHLS